MRQFKIVRYKSGRIFSKYIKPDGVGGKVPIKVDLKQDDLDQFLEELVGMGIPAFPKHKSGCDGSYTELKMGGYTGMSSYRWWSVPPQGWEVLEGFVNKVLYLSDVRDL